MDVMYRLVYQRHMITFDAGQNPVYGFGYVLQKYGCDGLTQANRWMTIPPTDFDTLTEKEKAEILTVYK